MAGQRKSLKKLALRTDEAAVKGRRMPDRAQIVKRRKNASL
jgi:hypothetical protein